MTTSPHDRLDADLVKRERRASRAEMLTRWAGYLLVAGSILASFAAFLISLRQGSSPATVGALAAFAGLLTTFNTAFRFENRADWFCRRKNAYRRLHRQLLFPASDPVDLAAIATELSTLQELSIADFPRTEPTAFKPGQTKF